MAENTKTLFEFADPYSQATLNENELERFQKGGNPEIGFEHSRMLNGFSRDVELIRIWAGSTKLTLVPTRGMGILSAESNGKVFGWRSPIARPVHPQWVPISENSGLGWLDGFNEMFVRCGLTSNGAPEHNSDGGLLWPLHGRIANLPAQDLSIEVDESSETVTVRGKVEEARFHFYRLELQTEIQIDTRSSRIQIRDRVKNLGHRAAGLQMLYHCNFGPPVLASGSQIHIPASRVVPRNLHSAEVVNDWSTMGPPTPGSSEQVFFFSVKSDATNRSVALLTHPQNECGVAVDYDTSQLPCFTVWKNNVAVEDGYVVGLEPATNFPNPRSFEDRHDRVAILNAGEVREFDLGIELLTSTSQVENAVQRVADLQGEPAQILEQPDPDWCA